MTVPEDATIISELLGRDLHPALKVRLPHLVLQGLSLTLLGFVIPRMIGLTASGSISIFLVSASLSNSAKQLLDENRENIWQQKLESWQANRITALSFVALFVGMLVAYTIIAWRYGETELSRSFGFVFDAVRLREGQALTDHTRFATFGPIVANNLTVLACIGAIAFIYRAYGAMLTLSWNACIWALTLTVLGLRTLATTTTTPLLFVPLSMGAILPHLLLEGFGYVIGAIAAIFLSYGITRYRLGDPRFLRVLRACGGLLMVAIITLLIAGLLEAFFAPAVLSRL